MYKSLLEAQILTRFFKSTPNPIHDFRVDFAINNYPFADQDFVDRFSKFDYKPDYNYLVEKNHSFIIENPRSNRFERIVDKTAYFMKIPSKTKSRVRLFRDVACVASLSNLEMVDLMVVENSGESRYFFNKLEIHQEDFMKIIGHNKCDMKAILLNSIMDEQVEIDENKSFNLKKKIKI